MPNHYYTFLSRIKLNHSLSLLKVNYYLYVTGFKGVESGFPLDIPIDELCIARENAQIEHVHMNAFDGKFRGQTSTLRGGGNKECSGMKEQLGPGNP